MKMPECERDDCRFLQSGGRSTLVAYIPIYDENGVNTNPDRNTTTSNLECLSCGKRWVVTYCYNQTTYMELKNA